MSVDHAGYDEEIIITRHSGLNEELVEEVDHAGYDEETGVRSRALSTDKVVEAMSKIP